MAVFSNTVARRIARKTLIPDLQAVVDATSTWNQGDLLVFDVGTAKVILPAAETEGATFLGISPISIVDGNFPPIYRTDTEPPTGFPASAGPEYGDEHHVMLKGGDTLAPGGAVYLDPVSGPNFVQAAGTKQIGLYSGPAVTAPAAGLDVVILIGARYPADTLSF